MSSSTQLKSTYCWIDVWYNASLRDDDIAEQFAQPKNDISGRNQDVDLTHSSSLRIASWRCRGLIRRFLLSRAALPASSRISADKYSSTAARYTAHTSKLERETWNGRESDLVHRNQCGGRGRIFSSVGEYG